MQKMAVLVPTRWSSNKGHFVAVAHFKINPERNNLLSGYLDQSKHVMTLSCPLTDVLSTIKLFTQILHLLSLKANAVLNKTSCAITVELKHVNPDFMNWHTIWNLSFIIYTVNVYYKYHLHVPIAVITTLLTWR